MLRLSGLDSDGMTDDQRDAFVNMAENLGLEPGEAEDMVDLYLEEIEQRPRHSRQSLVKVVAPKAACRFRQWCRPAAADSEGSGADRRRGGTRRDFSTFRAASAAENAPRAIRSFLRWGARRRRLRLTNDR